MSRRLTHKQRRALSILIFVGGHLHRSAWSNVHRIGHQTTQSLLTRGFVTNDSVIPETDSEYFGITDEGRDAMSHSARQVA